ncbi:MAG TPA: nuclear transport factor 2 family protein [Pyrinomonadaceae bacterium]
MTKTAAMFCVVLLTTIFVVSCGNPTANTNANANAVNTNANAATAAAPTREALLEMDRKANEAFLKNDTAHFQSMLSDDFVGYYQGERMSKAEELKMIGSVKCEAKSWNLDDPQMSKINDDTYAISYRGTWDGTCTMDGKTEKMQTPVRASTVWHREGNAWKAVYHGETLVVDPKNPPAAEKKEAPSAETTAPSNTNTASNSNTAAAPAKPAASPNSDALVKLHQAGWEAFKNKDAKWFNEHISSNFGLVGPVGDWVGSKDAAIKLWTETMNCQGITNVSVSDGVATAVSPNVEILTIKGTANGTCDGQPNGPLYHTAVYVKEGDQWKLAYLHESPAG